MAVNTQDGDEILRFEHGKQLLPGIPNEVTLDLITSKVPWRDLCTLTCVSRSFQAAIRTNEVYDARVRANSRETLIAHCHPDGREFVALYSTIEKRCYELPPIPRALRGTLWTCQLVLLHSKLFVLGGSRGRPYGFPWALDLASSHVYVLDLAAQREWKKCANMQEARSRYGCGVVDGKIYVFGGIILDRDTLKPVLGAEVYDPEGNNWSPVMQITQGRFGCDFDYDVATVGEELLLYSEQRWLDRFHQDRYQTWLDISVGEKETPLAIYNPAKNEWRFVIVFGGKKASHESKMFVAKDKLYLFSHFGIDVYDYDKKSWRNLHANSFPPDEPTNYNPIKPIKILAVNDELVMLGWWSVPGIQSLCRSFHSKGFDSEEKEIVWQKINCSDIRDKISYTQL